jgi:hypothetical protein
MISVFGFYMKQLGKAHSHKWYNILPPSSGRRVSQARNQNSACCLLYGGFLLGLLFYPEDGGDMFLGNNG